MHHVIIYIYTIFTRVIITVLQYISEQYGREQFIGLDAHLFKYGELI